MSGANIAVYALWKVPHLLPAFTLKGGEVSRYVIGGADLMFPGISIPPEGFPSFEAGQPWAVKVPGNPAPIAVSFSDSLGLVSTQSFKILESYQLFKIQCFFPLCLMQVGITTMSSTEALKAGLRGKALRIVHYYRDMLWQVYCIRTGYT